MRSIVTLDVFAFLILAFSVAAAAYLIVVFRALPSKIARQREHPQADAINVCGWAGLLTRVFWFNALVWAFTRPSAAVVRSTGTQD